MNSEFVRQEVRALVNGRTQMGQVRPPQSPINQAAMMNNNNNTPNPTMSMGTPQQLNSNTMMNTTPDPVLGYNFETGNFSFRISIIFNYRNALTIYELPYVLTYQTYPFESHIVSFSLI